MWNSTKRWRPTFSMRFLLTVVAIFAVLLVLSTMVYRQYREALAVNYLVRLTAHGTVEWGDEMHAISEMRDEFSSAIEIARTHGSSTVRLFIVRYEDTKRADFDALVSVAKAAGFDAVDSKTLAWPTPEHLRPETVVELQQ